MLAFSRLRCTAVRACGELAARLPGLLGYSTCVNMIAWACMIVVLAAGKVCIIPRGEINFCEKATMCAAAGGVAAVIYNNAPGMFTGTLGSCPAGSSIPAFSMAQELAPRFADGGNVTAKVGSADIFGFKDG